jgi:hypothetical protein
MRKKFFLAPDGSSFACRRSGLQHMLREGFPAPAIAEMKAKLSHEGFCWFVHYYAIANREPVWKPVLHADAVFACLKAVLGIREILVRIRICGSVPLTNGSGSNSGSDLFLQRLKKIFHFFIFCLVTYPQAHYLSLKNLFFAKILC